MYGDLILLFRFSSTQSKVSFFQCDFFSPAFMDRRAKMETVNDYYKTLKNVKRARYRIALVSRVDEISMGSKTFLSASATTT